MPARVPTEPARGPAPRALSIPSRAGSAARHDATAMPWIFPILAIRPHDPTRARIAAPPGLPCAHMRARTAAPLRHLCAPARQLPSRAGSSARHDELAMPRILLVLAIRPRDPTSARIAAPPGFPPCARMRARIAAPLRHPCATMRARIAAPPRFLLPAPPLADPINLNRLPFPPPWHLPPFSITG